LLVGLVYTRFGALPRLAGLAAALGRKAMDFIETLFGLAPDGGSGLFEFLLFAVPLAGVALLHWRRKAARRRDENDQSR
jgi:hypothetical protein